MLQMICLHLKVKETPASSRSRKLDHEGVVGNSRNPKQVALAYTVDSRWRNKAEFVNGREAIVAFLKRKWSRELDNRLIKELWALDGNRISVRFAHEWHDDAGQWYRSYGNENWEYNEQGIMLHRHASINDLPIKEEKRPYHWPLGRCPDDYPGLSKLGLQRPGYFF
jgi:nuclear transport factor 2 (NTF2) superfamily protein